MAPSSPLPSASSVDPRGLLRAEFTSAEKQHVFLPLPQKYCACSMVTKLKLRYRRVKVSPMGDLGLHSELTSECTAEDRVSSSSFSSSSPSLSLSSERGIFFSTGSSFFRAQSSLGRDLAVLAAALYKRSEGKLRVLDVMSGCGVRALRYLTQSGADFVVANDCNPGLHNTIVENLSRYAPLEGLHHPPQPFIRGNRGKLYGTEYMIGAEYSRGSELKSHIDVENVNNGSNPSRQAAQPSVDAGSLECNGSPSPELVSSTTDSSCSTNGSSKSLENATVSREVENHLFGVGKSDCSQLPATESASLNSCSTDRKPWKDSNTTTREIYSGFTQCKAKLLNAGYFGSFLMMKFTGSCSLVFVF